MSIKAPITGDDVVFDRYITEAKYADSSGISRVALKIARRHLTEGEDWEHSKGRSVYWSRLGVSRLMKGMALSGGLVSARTLSEASNAIPGPRAGQIVPDGQQGLKEWPSEVSSQPLEQGYAEVFPVTNNTAAIPAATATVTWDPPVRQAWWARVAKKVPNPNLILVLVDGREGLVKVRVRSDSQWMIGDRIQVRDLGREVWEYAGRAPRYRGEFGGKGRL